MKGPIGRLLTQSGLYALGNAAIKAGGLILLLFYLDPALLAQAEYGRLVLIETAANLAVVLAGLGLAQGLLKYGTDAPLPTTATRWASRHSSRRPGWPLRCG